MTENHTCILIHRIDPFANKDRSREQTEELTELAESAGYTIISVITQTRTPDPRYQIGKGKAEELAQIVKNTGCEKVISYNRLSTVQLYNISQLTDTPVIDRFNLILEIFAKRATTSRSKMQVEFAELTYELPKAREKVSLSMKSEKPGFMGSGSYEDSYEQDVQRRMVHIKRQLVHENKLGEITRTKRHEKGFSLVALAGYTNAGKSTLLNALTDASVTAKDQLFTTLVPTTKVLEIDGRKMFLTDTVGFIDDLPHWMVDAFRSTLDEVFLADIIILVVDINDPVETIRRKLTACHDTLWDEIGSVEIVTAINKCDMLPTEKIEEKMKQIEYLTPNPILVSAKQGIGLVELRGAIGQHLPAWKKREVALITGKEGMSALSWLFEVANVKDVRFGEEIVVDFEAPEGLMGMLRSKYGKALAPTEADVDAEL